MTVLEGMSFRIGRFGYQSYVQDNVQSGSVHTINIPAIHYISRQ